MAMLHGEHGVDSDLAQAAQALRRAAAQPATPRERWRAEVKEALLQFEHALTQHKDHTEGRDGSFDQALERTLGRVRAEIQRLTRDHVLLWSQVHFLDERLEAEPAELAADVDGLVEAVAAHTVNAQRLSARSHVQLE